MGEEAKATVAAAMVINKDETSSHQQGKKLGDLDSWFNFLINKYLKLILFLFSIKDGEWCLTLQQIIATVLAQPALASFFEGKYPLLLHQRLSSSNCSATTSATSSPIKKSLNNY